MTDHRTSQAAGDFFHGFADTFDTFYDGKRSHVMRWIDQRFRRDMFLRFDWTFEHLGDLKGKSGIDIGCGSGPYVAEALRRGAAHMTAFDPAPRMLELTYERVQSLGSSDRLTLVEGFFPQNAPAGKFDFAIVMGVMDYVDDKLAFLKGLRGLGDSLHAAVSFPSRHWLRSPIRKVRYNLRKCPLWFYTEPQIRQLGAEAGFGTVEIRKIPAREWTFTYACGLEKRPTGNFDRRGGLAPIFLGPRIAGDAVRRGQHSPLARSAGQVEHSRDDVRARQIRRNVSRRGSRNPCGRS